MTRRSPRSGLGPQTGVGLVVWLSAGLWLSGCVEQDRQYQGFSAGSGALGPGTSFGRERFGIFDPDFTQQYQRDATGMRVVSPDKPQAR